ncbi:TspO/MBR family protein [Halalkalirubrum salinum]|uniref:TspO/MBR family protein n=1 Tax=Halalkalirubrum salinum TaxID=2563889 RepID=UPI0010FAEE68|nr:TspO/MBR family protein [Halalkalirubrum salinum]
MALALPQRIRSIPRDDLLGAIVAIVLVNLVGASGVVFTNPNSEWFQSLTLPWFYPPPALFGIVWTLLFSLLGVAVYLVYRSPAGRSRSVALVAFGVQMAFNVAWSPAFFAAESPTLGLAVIIPLFGLILATIVAFDRVNRRAAGLLVPYLLWVGFATVLNGTIYLLN